MPMILVAVACYSFSLAKMLALSEDAGQLRYPGMWFSVAWSILSSTVQAGLCYVFLARTPEGYARLDEEIAREGEREPLSPGGTTTIRAAVGISELPGATVRQPTCFSAKPGTWEHIVKLLSYCKEEWKWFASGFFFLIIYAVGEFFIATVRQPEWRSATIRQLKVKKTAARQLEIKLSHS